MLYIISTLCFVLLLSSLSVFHIHVCLISSCRLRAPNCRETCEPIWLLWKVFLLHSALLFCIVGYYSLCMSFLWICFSFCYSTAMHESSKRVQECLADMYEPEWYGKDEMDSVIEVTALSTLSLSLWWPQYILFFLSHSICFSMNFYRKHYLLYLCFMLLILGCKI